MAPTSNHRLIFNSIPQGYPVLGQTLAYNKDATIDLADTNLLQPGEVLVKPIALSIDPYLRDQMRPAEVQGYPPAFTLGEAISGYGIVEIINPNGSDLKLGDHLFGTFDFQDYSVIKPGPEYRVIKNEEKLDWSLYVGVLGMPGKTAYYGYKEYVKGKKGDTLFVTTGAGPVGATVIQLAKANGLRVIASAGSDAKVAFMKEIGADVAFNYKTTDTGSILAEHGPVHIYWDQVGGPVLDTTLNHMALKGTIIICGQASQRNSDEKYGVKNIGKILASGLSVHGLWQLEWESKHGAEFYREMPTLIKDGKIKYLEDVTHGLENGDKAMLDVMTGNNHGKAVIVL